MAEVGSTAIPLSLLGGVSVMSVFAGADTGAAVMAFAGALLFAFMAQNTTTTTRVLGLISSWIFGYYAAAEFVKRGWLGFDTTPIPAFISAFFCIVVFRLLLVLWEKHAAEWFRKKLGLSPEGTKRE